MRCSAKSVDPGKSCQMLVHFKPTTPGEKEASLFFITGNPTQPVTPVGVNGTGVGPPGGRLPRRTGDRGSRADLLPHGLRGGTAFSTSGFATAVT